MQKKTLRLILAAILVCAVICFIFSNSFQNGEASNQRSGLVLALFQRLFDPHHRIDEETFHYFIRKGAHFSEFALLGASLMLLKKRIRDRFCVSTPGVMLFAALAVAVTDEFIQSFTGRTSSVKDVLIDFSGALCAILLLTLLGSIYRKWKG